MKSVSKSKNKKKNNIFDLKQKKKVNSKGFTLIEVLAMIAILSIIISVVVYFAIDTVKNAKNKSYQVTISNIEQEVRDYALEEITKLSWVPVSSTNYEYQCVTVQDLIDTGYFKGDVLNSYVKEDRKVLASDYIYIEKDRDTKTITKNILLVGDEYDALLVECEYVPEVDEEFRPEIKIVVTPQNGWAKKKRVDITYSVNNLKDGLTYEYEYESHMVGYEKNLKNEFDAIEEIEQIIVEDNGNLLTSIKIGDETIVSVNREINGIDNLSPVASIKSTNNVASSQTATLVMNDSQSGIKEYYFGQYEEPDDILFIDGQNKKSLEINTPVDGSGTWYLIVSDLADNVSKQEVEFYDTSLSISNGSVNPSIVLTMAGNSFKVPNGVAASGYSFIGWYTGKNGTGSSVTTYKPTSNSTLYAYMGEVFVPDTTVPTITFSYDGNDNWIYYAMSNINVYDDDSGVDESSLKMVYSSSSSPIDLSVNASASTGIGMDLTFEKIYSFSNGAFVASEAGDGYYYLHAYACDNAGNCGSKISGKFKLDNTGPDAEMIAASVASSRLGVQLNMSDSLSGISQYCFATTKGGCSSWDSANNLNTVEKTYNITKGGTWYLIVRDAAGNLTEVSKNVYNIEFSIQNGSISTGALLVAEGNSLTLPTPTMDSGYEFVGWYDGAKYVGMGGSTYTPTSSTELYGHSSSNTVEEDTTSPIISVNPDGTIRYVKSQSVSISAYDDSGIKTLKYAVNQSSTYNFNGGKNGTSISSPYTYTFSGKTGTYYLHVYAEDYEGNYEEFHSSPYYLDSTSPSVTMSSTSNDSTEQEVSLGMSDDDSGIAAYYWGSVSYTGTSLLNYPHIVSTSKTVGTAGTYGFYAVDAAGNQSNIVTITFYKTQLIVDGDEKTYIITPQNNSFNIPSVGIPSGYTLTGWANSSGTKVADVGGSYKPTSSGALYAMLEKIVVDNTAPSISFYPNGSNGYVKPLNTTITAEDSSGIKSLKYDVYYNGSSIASNTVNSSSVIYTLPSTTGEYKIYAYACDTLNHCSGKYSNSFYIDVTKPTVSISSSNKVDSKQSVKLEFSDEHSGIYSYSWKAVDLDAVEMIYSGETSANVEISAPGEVSLTATDAAGNTNSTSVTFYKTILRVPGSSDDNIITLSGNSFTLPNVSPASGYKFVGWNTNENGTGVSYGAGSSYTVTSTTTLYAILEKVIVDTTGPIITFTKDGTDTFMKGDVSTIISAIDPSGISILKIYPSTNPNLDFDGTTSGNPISSGDSYNFSRKTGIYYIYAYACDNLGNCTKTTSNAFKLDNTPPSLNISNPYSNSNWYNSYSVGDYVLKLSGSDIDSGISHYNYTDIGSGVYSFECNDETCYTKSFDDDADGRYDSATVKVRVCDKAGNCTEGSTRIFRDTAAPTVACYNDGAWASQTFSQGFDCTLETLGNNGYFNGSRPTVGDTIYHTISKDSKCSVSYTKMNCDASGSFGSCSSVFNASDNFGIGNKICDVETCNGKGDCTSSGRWRATECNCINEECTATLSYKVYDIAGNYAENTFVYSHLYDDANEFASKHPQYCPS